MRSRRQDPPSRADLRIRGHRGNRVVCRALIRFARWLRTEYEFPMRVPVYLSPNEHVTTVSGERASASFFAPFDREVEPFIRIATGDYTELRARRGRDNALASFVCSFAHEVIHYRQWIETGEVWEDGVARRAVRILRNYARSTDRQ